MVPQDAASPRPSARELPTLETRRLLLRPWRAEDRAVFAEINGDPRVMEHYPSVLSPSQSAAIAERIEAHFLEHGFGLWAVELSTAREFIGFIGLQTIRFQAAFTPGVEIGWRLAADRWGSGYATEGARAAAAFGFDVVGLEEILAFTVPSNQASRRVMEKLGMRHDADGDFDHPSLPAGGPLRRHVLYRLRSPAFGQTLAHRRLTRWTPHPMDASPDGRLTRWTPHPMTGGTVRSRPKLEKTWNREACMSESTTSAFGLGPIGQIAVPVSDVDRAVDFYRDVLGMRLLFQAPPGLAFFDCGGVRLMLDGPSAANAGNASVIYYRVPDLDAAFATLSERGVTFEAEPHLIAKLPDHELWMAFLRDPDGNLLALMSEVRD